MHPGLIGGLIGAGVGALGGVIGTYYSIKNTNGPRERAFMMKMALLTWAFVIIFLAGLFTIPRPYQFLLWIPYGICLPLLIRTCNKNQQLIRDDESQHASRESFD